MTRIILVHCINNEGKSEDQLIGEWLGAIQTVFSPQQMSQLRNNEIIAPYYGDELKRITDDAPFLPKPTEQSIQSLDDPSSQFLAQSLTEMALSAGLDETLLNAENPGQVIEQSLTQNRYVNSALRFLEKASPWKLRYGMILLRQAYVYLNLAHASKAVDEIVGPAMRSGSPTVVIAHSLGTIVSFKALREIHNPGGVDYITLGSPLGLKSVKQSIGPSFATPAGMNSWFNALDKDDIVTLGTTLANRGYGSNDLMESSEIENGRKDPHSIAKYLTSPWVKANIEKILNLNG